MNFIEYVNSNSPITNLPDLFNLHHSNPLGISVWGQMIFILVVVTAMGIVNFFIRYRDKAKLYPALYTLLTISVIAIYYYCFQSGLRMYSFWPDVDPRPIIGWFCQPKMVGTLPAAIGLIVLTYVIFILLSAIMQVAAQCSVEAKLIEGKPWKEWKVLIFIILVGVLVVNVALFVSYVACSWALIALEVLIIAFIIYKIIADSLRCHNIGWGLAIGLPVLIGSNAALMLSLECLRGTVLYIVVLAAFLTQAKARKKKPKQKSE